jgi:hypothetical protein
MQTKSHWAFGPSVRVLSTERIRRDQPPVADALLSNTAPINFLCLLTLSAGAFQVPSLECPCKSETPSGGLTASAPSHDSSAHANSNWWGTILRSPANSTFRAGGCSSPSQPTPANGAGLGNPKARRRLPIGHAAPRPPLQQVHEDRLKSFFDMHSGFLRPHVDII